MMFLPDDGFPVHCNRMARETEHPADGKNKFFLMLFAIAMGNGLKQRYNVFLGIHRLHRS